MQRHRRPTDVVARPPLTGWRLSGELIATDHPFVHRKRVACRVRRRHFPRSAPLRELRLLGAEDRPDDIAAAVRRLARLIVVKARLIDPYLCVGSDYAGRAETRRVFMLCDAVADVAKLALQYRTERRLPCTGCALRRRKYLVIDRAHAV